MNMSPKLTENTSARKNRSSSKHRDRCRTKKLDKSRLPTNIPLPVTLMRSQSFERKTKLDTPVTKTKKTDAKSLSRSRSTSLKRKIAAKEPGVIVLERVGKVSKKSLSSPTDADVPTPKTNEGNKLRGFNEILPLCEKELRKIEDAWLSAAYCSLSMRANLFKFLNQSFPNIDKGQFYTEDRKLVQYFEQLKNSNKAETQNLLGIIKSVLANREKTKDEYNSMYKSEKDLRKKITQTKEEAKQLKSANGLLPSTKSDDVETTETEKPQVPDFPNKKRDGTYMSFYTIGTQQNSPKSNTFNYPGKTNEKNLKGHHGPNSKLGDKNPKSVNYNLPSKQNENNSKASSVSTAEEQKLENVKSLSIKKDFEALKTNFLTENETLEKKVRELENMLQEKIKTLKCEKEMKDQLNSSLTHFQTQKNTMSMSHGFEQVEYILEPQTESREKWRKELWLTAIRLILSGFFVQLRNLETERNKMLYQLQSNDIDNFNALVVTIIRKENFIKSIRHQVKALNDSYQSRKSKPTEIEDEKN